MSCQPGYKLRGPDELVCANGTITPSYQSVDCEPMRCDEKKAPTFGNVVLQPPGKDPKHNSVYRFSCLSTHWLDGPEQMKCWTGKWEPRNVPRCNPKPCFSRPCLNDGTCNNIGNYLRKCSCTDKWHGDNCQRRTVHKDKLIQFAKQFLTDSNGECKERELLNKLTNSIHGFPSYIWLVLCRKKQGTSKDDMDSNRIIKVQSDKFDLFVGWQDKYSPPGIISRYARAKTKVSDNLTDLEYHCDFNEMVKEVKSKLKEINISYMNAMVMVNGVATWASNHQSISWTEKTFTCYNRAATLCPHCSHDKKHTAVIIMGALEK